MIAVQLIFKKLHMKPMAINKFDTNSRNVSHLFNNNNIISDVAAGML